MADKRKMRTVKVSVRTRALYNLEVIPIMDVGTVKDLLCDSFGAYDDSTAESVSDLQCSENVYFTNASDVLLAIKDGEEEKQQEDLPFVSADTVMDYLAGRLVELEEIDEDDEDAKAERALYEKVGHGQYCEVGMYDGPAYVEDFIQKLGNNGLDCNDGFCFGYIRNAIDYRLGVDREDDESRLALLNFGNLGRGTISFDIEVPEGEEFDISKLHFMLDDYWWDAQIADSCSDFGATFDGVDVMLEFVEYDGRIYGRSGENFVPGWHSHGGTVLVHPNLTPVEDSDEIDASPSSESDDSDDDFFA